MSIFTLIPDGIRSTFTQESEVEKPQDPDLVPEKAAEAAASSDWFSSMKQGLQEHAWKAPLIFLSPAVTILGSLGACGGTASSTQKTIQEVGPETGGDGGPPRRSEKTKILRTPVMPMVSARPFVPKLSRTRIELLEKRFAMEFIKQLENHPDPKTRERAASGLGNIGGDLAFPALIRALAKDPEAGVRAKAASSLGKLGFKEASPILELASAKDPDASVKSAAQQALQDLKKGRLLSPRKTTP